MTTNWFYPIGEDEDEAKLAIAEDGGRTNTETQEVLCGGFTV